MGIGKRIKEAREHLGLTQEELGRKIGVTGSAITNYEKEVSHPKEPIMYALLRELKVDPNYLFQDCVTIRHPAPFNLSEYEKNYIKKYRALDEHGKDHVNKVLDWEIQRIKEISSLKQQVIESEENAADMPTIPLRLSNQGAAAGHGTYLGPEDFRIITVLKNDLTRAANFAVPVSGDSMEPKFHDGDILLVGDEIPEVDDIGIFTMDGKGYVKKMGENELVSLNPAYAPIPMDDSIISNGKVIGVLEPEMIVK